MSAPRNTAGPHKPGPTGTILDNELLPLRVALDRLGWGSRSLSLAKQRGLKVLCFGKRSYLHGRDILAFLQDQPTIERHGGPGRPDLVAGRLAEDGQST
jgi:hypothetical protein